MADPMGHRRFSMLAVDQSISGPPEPMAIAPRIVGRFPTASMVRELNGRLAGRMRSLRLSLEQH